MNGRVLLSLGAAILGVCVAGCTTVVQPVMTVTVTAKPSVAPPPSNVQVLDQTTLEQGVENILNDAYKDNATDVKCPADEQVAVGNSFTCTATIGGSTEQVQVTVKSTDGQFEVGEPHA